MLTIERLPRPSVWGHRQLGGEKDAAGVTALMWSQLSIGVSSNVISSDSTATSLLTRMLSPLDARLYWSVRTRLHGAFTGSR